MSVVYLDGSLGWEDRQRPWRDVGLHCRYRRGRLSAARLGPPNVGLLELVSVGHQGHHADRSEHARSCHCRSGILAASCRSAHHLGAMVCAAASGGHLARNRRKVLYPCPSTGLPPRSYL